MWGTRNALNVALTDGHGGDRMTYNHIAIR